MEGLCLPPLLSPTSGKTLWTQLLHNTRMGVRIQQYMQGTKGVLGSFVRSLKGEVPHQYRIITDQEPYYVLAEADSEPLILSLYEYLQDQLPTYPDVVWYCQSELLVHELQTNSHLHPAESAHIVAQAQAIAGSCESLERLHHLYARVREISDRSALRCIGPCLRERMAMLFHTQVISSGDETVIAGWRDRLVALSRQAGLDADEQIWVRMTLNHLNGGGGGGGFPTSNSGSHLVSETGNDRSPTTITAPLAAPIPATASTASSTGSSAARAAAEFNPESTKTCVICLENPIRRCVVPCGHACLCEFCCAGLDKCPLCRGRIERTIVFYLP